MGSLNRFLGREILLVLVVSTKVGLWNEAGGLPGLVNLFVHLIDILEGKTLSLVDECPDEGDTDEAASTPDKEDLCLQVGIARTFIDHIGGGETDSEVEKPVGSSGHGETLCTDLEREDLTSDNPCDGTPRDGKEENVEADESNENLVGNICEDCDTDNSNNELADTHPNGSQQKKTAATKFLNEVKTGDSRYNIDQVGNETDEESILNTGVLEELGTIVENEVDTGQLLKGLETTSGHEPLDHLGGETVGIGSLAERQLILVDSLDFVKFLEETGVVDRERTETAHGAGSTLEIVLLDKEARSLGKDKHPNRENKSPDELDGERDTIRAGIVTVVGALVGASSQKKTDGNSQLVAPDNSSSDPFR